MNAILYPKPGNKTVCLTGAGLPRIRFHEWDTRSAQIAAYLRRLLQVHQDATVADVQIPSLLELADIFDCCELDLFEALNELKQQAYRYEMNGLDCPIRLSDPLLRKPTNLRRKGLRYYVTPCQRLGCKRGPYKHTGSNKHADPPAQ